MRIKLDIVRPGPAAAALLLLLLLAAGACGKKTGDRTGGTTGGAATLTAALEDYLAKRGDLCIARPTWPIDVTELDRQQRSRDWLQLPPLEKAGVVTSSPLTVTVDGEQGPVPLRVRRYQLTERGRQFYIDRRTRRPAPPGAGQAGWADLCVARLSLARIVGRELTPDDRQPTTAVVSYTYNVEAPAWVREPEVLRVFPAVARVIAGAGTAQLREGFVRSNTGWVARELAAEAPAAVAARAQP